MKFKTLLFATATTLCSLQSNAQVSYADSMLLVDFYNTHNGNGWTNKTNWLTSAPITTWYGVNTNSTVNNAIVSVELPYNNIVGTTDNLQSTLFKISTLETVNLNSNNINGMLYSPMYNSANLMNTPFGNIQKLLINNNQIFGTLPGYFNLRTLDFSNNQLFGNIPQFAGTQIVDLALNNNNLSGSIPTLTSSMIHLDVSNNSLSGTLPLIQGTQIQIFRAKNNQLTGGVPAMNNNVSDYEVSNNLLDGIIQPIDTLYSPGLKNYRIDANYFNFSDMDTFVVQTGFNFVHRVSTYYNAFNSKNTIYSPQAIVPLIRIPGTDTFDASNVGGIPERNTYYWYRNGVLIDSVFGTSKYKATVSGNYQAIGKNQISTFLNMNSNNTAYAQDTTTKLKLYTTVLPFTVPMPIGISKFTAEKINNSAQLDWTAEDTKDNGKFTVEHSKDGLTWSAIGTINAASMQFQYNFRHEKPQTGLNVYRIKFEQANELKYSISKALNFDKERIMIYPIPANSHLIIKGAEKEKFSLYSYLGELVQSGIVISNEYNLTIGNLSAGSYTIKIGGKTFSFVKF